MKKKLENSVLDNRKRRKTSLHIGNIRRHVDKNADVILEKAQKSKEIIGKYLDRMSVLKRRFSTIEVQINGKNASRALIAISKICRVENVKNGDGFLRFCLDGKHLSKIIALLQNLCYDYKIVSIGGVIPQIASTLSRLGIVIGIAIYTVCFFVYSGYVGQVNVSYIGCADIALKGKVDSILKEHGVQKGIKFDSIDIDVIQDALSSLDDIAYADVRRAGNKLTIQLKGALHSDYVLDIAGSSVVASKRAVLTRVVVEGGTAVKEYGDIVNVGDVIIDGYTMYGDDKILTEASGYAYGIVYYEKARFFPSEEVERQIVDTKRYTRLGMFSKVPQAPQSPYENYTLHTSIKDFGFLLPLKIYTYEYCSIVESIKSSNLNDDEMKSIVYSDLLCELSETARIKDVHYEITATQNGVTVRVLLEAEEIIT